VKVELTGEPDEIAELLMRIALPELLDEGEMVEVEDFPKAVRIPKTEDNGAF